MNTRELFLSFVFPILFSCTLECQTTYVDVDTSGRLRPEEIEYISRRDRRTHTSITQLLGKEVPDSVRLPRIAFIGSGGGFRATTDYIAMLAALHRAGIFDCGTYAAGLSGGAWAIFPLVLRGLDPVSYSEILKQRLCQRDTSGKKNILLKLAQIFFENYKKREAKKSKINFVETWGAIVSERLFGDIAREHCLTFNDIRANLSQSDAFPYPVCPVLIGQTAPNYEWIDINPFGIYSSCLGGSIPNAAFGNVFESGHAAALNKSQLSLEFYMGMVGSAFCLSIGDIIFNVIRDLLDMAQADEILSITGADHFVNFTLGINRIIGKFGLYKERFFPAKIPNYSYQMQGSKLKTLQTLELFDAGAFINLPFPTLIRKDRGIDIYIVCDSSSDASDRDFTELRYAADWARAKGAKFPSLNKFKVVSPDMRIFYEDDTTVPYIIYFSNQIEVGTTELFYTTEEFDKLFGFMHENVLNGSPAIVDVIRKKLNIPNTFDALPQGVPPSIEWESPLDFIKHHCSIL